MKKNKEDDEEKEKRKEEKRKERKDKEIRKLKRQVEEEDADGEGWEKVKYGVAIPSVSINHYSAIKVLGLFLFFFTGKT